MRMAALLAGVLALLGSALGAGSRTMAPVARLLFSSDRDGSDAIYLTNTDGARAVRVAAGTEPDWCGGRVVLVRSGDLFLANLDGTAEQRLTRTAVGEAHPTCSPDGTHVAFSRSETASGSDLYVLDLSSGRERRLTAIGTATQPAWSPAPGAAIAFVTNGRVAVMNDDGSDVRMLSRGPGIDANPAWLGESKVLFDRTVDGKTHVWFTGSGVDAAGAGPGEQLTGEPGDQQNPAFTSLTLPLPYVFQARDGEGDERIYASNVGGSVVELLTTGPGADIDPALEPPRPLCTCTGVEASLRVSSSPALRRQAAIRLTVHWTLHCSAAPTAVGACRGRVVLATPSGSLRLVGPSGRRSRQVMIACAGSTCRSTTSGTSVRLVGYGQAPARGRLVTSEVCTQGTRDVSVQKPMTYELSIDADGRPALRRRSGF